MIFCLSLQNALSLINCEDTKRVISAPRPSVSPRAKREAWSWKTKTSHYWSERNLEILKSGVCYQPVVEAKTEIWDKEQAASWFGKRHYNPLVSHIWRTLVAINMAHDWSLETEICHVILCDDKCYMWYSMTSTQLFSHSLKQCLWLPHHSLFMLAFQRDRIVKKTEQTSTLEVDMLDRINADCNGILEFSLELCNREKIVHPAWWPWGYGKLCMPDSLLRFGLFVHITGAWT